MSGNMVNDLAYLTIDFKADFSSLFDWNTKQLFIYIFAEYSTADNVSNTYWSMYNIVDAILFLASQPGGTMGQNNAQRRESRNRL